MVVEHVPETMVHFACLLQKSVERSFCPAFNAAQKLWIGHDVVLIEGSVDSLPIGEKKGVADIEENCLGGMRHSKHFKSRSPGCSLLFRLAWAKQLDY